MKILILGAKGMAGHMLHYYFTENTNDDVAGMIKPTIDARWNREQIKEIIGDTYDVIINCIGLIHDKAKDPSLTFQVNSAFPHILDELSSELNFKLIHLSSDCALDNTIYGKSKLAGEINNSKNLTVRTSIIGPELTKNGTGLFNWFMHQKEVTGYYKVKWDGITTLQLAKEIHSMIILNSTGYIDLRCKEKTNKYTLLCNIRDIYQQNTSIDFNNNIHSDKTNITPDKITNINYTTQLNELKEFMLKHSELYKDIYRDIYDGL